MKALIAVAIAVSLTSCVSTRNESNHWNPDFVAGQVTYQFLGYQEDIDGTYRQKLARDWNGIGLTLRRHLFHDNPSNPLQPGDKQVAFRPDPPAVEFQIKNP